MSKGTHLLELFNQFGLLILRLDLCRLDRLQDVRQPGAMTQHRDDWLLQPHAAPISSKHHLLLIASAVTMTTNTRQRRIACQISSGQDEAGLMARGREECLHARLTEIGFQFAGEVLVFG